MTDFIISKAQKLLQKHCEDANIDDSHGITHALAVLKHTENAIGATMLNLSESQKLSICLAALLHDADDHKYFGKEASQNMTHARNIMEKAGVDSTTTIENALECISLVSCSQNGNSFPEKAKQHPEMLWPRWSDRLEASGEIGIARCFLYTKDSRSPFVTESTPRPTTAEEVFSLASEERFAEYQKRGGGSASMLDHYYDKLIQISRPSPNLVQNKYLEDEAEKRVEPLVTILLKYGKSGEVPISDIEAITEKLSLSSKELS